MTLISRHTSPLEDVWVSLGLETTGVSVDNDEIVEVGAVKFQGAKTLDTYQTLVNPRQRLSDFIIQSTGITQAEVEGAPSFSRVAGALASFVGSVPIVGHNVTFAMGFLSKKGLRFSNPRCDTWDLAYVLWPGFPDYSLAGLVAALDLPRPRSHRALDDAMATKEVFLKLAERLAGLDVYTLAEMQRLATRSSWSLSHLLRGFGARGRGTGDWGLRTEERSPGPHSPFPSPSPSVSAEVGALGLDVRELGKRLQHGRALRPNQRAQELDVDFVASLLRSGSPLARAFPAFEERPQQVEMARAVAGIINSGGRLIVEAGTGVGKSLAYLLPAALYALTNNKRVVISTNTINLQEQLLSKDIPNLVRALAEVEGIPTQELKFAQLKGRANYLCLKRWAHLRAGEAVSDSEARLLAKTLMWLKTTATGDRAELNLGYRSAAAPWDRMSAQGSGNCMSTGGPCFLRAAREKAAASHLVVVNHALLLSDIATGGALLPEYDTLIVDEAHHLEEEATRQLGFELAQMRFDDHIQTLSGDRGGLLNEAINAFRGSSAAASRRSAVEKQSAETTLLLPRMRERVAGLFAMLAGAIGNAGANAPESGQDLRITRGTRAQPAWSQLEVEWESVDILLAELGKSLGKLYSALEGLEDANLVNYEGLMMELANAQQANADLREKLAEVISRPKPDGIYWVTRGGGTTPLSPPLAMGETGGAYPRLTLHAAPLHVGETLDQLLFSEKRCVIMTSATLSAGGTFNHVCERTGFAGAEELLLGSPFDYPRAALLCVPEDMPEPSSWAYQAALEEAITDAALAAGGRTMALFTSHSSLQATASAIRGKLFARGIAVLAQGINGTPPQLVRRFLENPKAVLLGTASFWEGVDLSGESLKVLVVTRLPFSVPTEPVFAARSELYEDSFGQYAVPQAILRLRQGFGRLIRTRTDRGVAVILDRRIVSKRYGKAFLDSLPRSSFKTCQLHELPGEIKRWVRGSRQ